VQIPPVVLSIILVQWKLNVPQKGLEQGPKQSTREKLQRIDFGGALLMSITILTTLFVLDTGGQKYAWSHPIIIASACIAAVGAIGFWMQEKHGAKEPIFPVQLLARYVVVTSYGIMLLQNFSQTAVSRHRESCGWNCAWRR
jgi:hypothetical protein